MANIIDATYFVGEIEVANANQPEILEDLNNSITLYEQEVLIALLGYLLYKELRAATIVPGDKFDKLINGEEFSFTLGNDTIDTKWEGLKGYNKKSLIAYYVYFYHRKKRASYNAGVGIEVEPETDNSVNASLYTKLTEVWNEFVLLYGDSCSEGAHENATPSAYNYLLAKNVDFPTWNFETQGGELNRFGI